MTLVYDFLLIAGTGVAVFIWIMVVLKMLGEPIDWNFRNKK